MKFRYLLASVAAVWALASGCTKSLPGDLDELKVSNSFVSIPAEGGTAEITIEAKRNWAFEDDAEAAKWLKIEPKSGTAGETKVSFKADATINTQQAVLKIKLEKVEEKEEEKVQYINVKQQVGSGDPEVITCDKVKDLPEGKEVMVEGVCTAILNSKYGNWNIKDNTAEILIYGTKDWATHGIEVGDLVLVQGAKKDFNGTIELVDVKVVKITKSLVKVEPKKVEIEKEAAEFTISASYKGELSVKKDADWISFSAPIISSGSASYKFNATENTGVVPRKAVITFMAKKDGQVSEVAVEVVQKGNEPPLSTIKDAIALNFAHVQGQVSAISKKGYVLTDDSGSVFVYTDKLNDKMKIGEKRKVVGAVAAYNYGPQLKDLVIDEFIENGEFKHPAAAVLDAASMAAKVGALTGDGKATEINVEFVSASGKVKVDPVKGYINILVEGEATMQISPYGPLDSFGLKDKNDKNVTIEGYLTSISGKKKFFNVVVTKVTEI